MSAVAAGRPAGAQRARALPWWMWIAALTVLGGVLRIAAASYGLLGDELFSHAIVTQDSLRDVWHGIRETENTPPASYVLEWLVARVTDQPEWIRLPSVVLGTATIPVVAHVATRAFGRRAGYAAAVLIALSPFEIYYGSEARAYAPAVFCVAVSTLALLEGLPSGRRRWWILLALASAAALWFHYVAVFPIAAQFAWAFVARPAARRPVVLAALGAAVLYLPWLPYFGANVSTALIGALYDFGARQVVEYPVRALVGYPYVDLDDCPGVPLLAGLGALLVICWWLGRGRRAGGPWTLFALAAVSAPAGLLLYTLVSDNLFLPRNLIVSAPAAAVLAGALIGRLETRRATAATLVLAALLAYPAYRVAFGDLTRPAYDAAAASIDDRGRPADPVLEIQAFPINGPLRNPLTIFLDPRHPHFQEDQASQTAWRAGVRAGTLWVVAPSDTEELPDSLRERLTVRVPPGIPMRLAGSERWDGLFGGVRVLRFERQS